jgi:biotin carboxyl carrier protein
MTSTVPGRTATSTPAPAGPRHRRARGATPLRDVRRAELDAPDPVEAELAEPIRVISARIWAIVAALVLAMSTAVVWAFVGTWPQHLSTPAIVMHGSGPQLARAATQGSVVELDVAVGQPVTAGQRVAIVQQADGTRSTVVAPAAGTVAAVLTTSGTPVLPGSPIVSVDVDSAPPTAELVVNSAPDLQRLAAGQQVLLDIDSAPVTGRIAAASPVKTTGAAVADELTVGSASLPSGDAPVWLVPVVLDARQRIAGPSAAMAVVELPNIRVYKLVTGTSQ